MDSIMWPAAAVIIAIAFFIIFKRSISSLLDRTEKVSKNGLEASAAKGQQLKKPDSNVEEFLKVYDNQLILETENLIKANLDELEPEDVKQREKFYLRNLAAVIITLKFEKIYYTIYGSQIAGLEYLNSNKFSAVSKEKLINYYNNLGKANYPEIYKNYSYEEWLQYLISQDLIKMADENISISIWGKEFLKYIIDKGHISNKFG